MAGSAGDGDRSVAGAGLQREDVGGGGGSKGVADRSGVQDQSADGNVAIQVDRSGAVCDRVVEGGDLANTARDPGGPVVVGTSVSGPQAGVGAVLPGA